MRSILAVAILAVFTTALAAQDCPPAIRDRLAGSGVSVNEAERLCAAASALVGNAIVIDARGDLLNDLVRVVLPFGARVALNDARYCGATGDHAADFIAAATSDGVISTGGPLGVGDCTNGLASIAGRIVPSGEGGWAVVARMKLEWTPWRLTLTADDAAGAGALPEPWPQLRDGLLGSQNARVIDTTAAAFPTPAGSLPALSSRAAFYFSRESFAIVIAPSSVLTAIAEDTPLPPLRVIAGERPAIANTNASIILGHDALNRFAAEFLSQSPIPIQTDHVPPGGQHRQVIGLADLTAARVAGGVGSYTINGKLRREGGDYHATIVLAADSEGDLAVTDVRITPPRFDCSDAFDVPTCLVRFLASSALIPVAEETARDVLKDKPWISFLEKRELELPWGADALAFNGNIRRITSDGEALVLSCNLRLRRR